MYLIVAHHMVNHNSFDFLGQDNSFRKVILSLFEYIPGKIGIALFFIASAWFLSSGNQSLEILQENMETGTRYRILESYRVDPAIPS